MLFDSDLLRYATIYPGTIVAVISVFTIFNPQAGKLLLLGTAILGAFIYLICDNGSSVENNPARKFSVDSPSVGQQCSERDMRRGLLTGRALVLGVGLWLFAIIALSVFYMTY